MVEPASAEEGSRRCLKREATAYRAVRERTTDSLRNVDPGALDAIAPATPEWRVRDVLAHLVGVTDDVVDGRLDGVATDPWTAAQVDARRDASVSDMLAEWDAFGPQFETMLLGAPETIGESGRVRRGHARAGHPPRARRPGRTRLRRRLGSRSSSIVRPATGPVSRCCASSPRPARRRGHGDPVATVKTSTFEFVRAATGRRSAEEIAAYDWDGTADPAIILVAPIFTMRETPLGE